jgi:phosphate transport system protein
MIIKNSGNMSKKDKTLKDILDFILYENPSTQDEIAEQLGITRRYVTQLLQPLVKNGTVKRAYMIDLKDYEKIAGSLSEYSSSRNSKGNVIVNDMLINMAAHVHSQLEASFTAVLEYDEDKADKALEMDYATNNMVEKIRTSVETIVSMNKHSEFSKSMLYTEVAYDLERIGDYCGHIAKFVINDVYEIDENVLKKLKKMYKTAQKMIRLAMTAFIEGKTELKDDLMELEDSIHILQSKAINLIATQMAENSFDEKERSNYFIYLFRVIKAFERMGDISVEIMDVSIEFHDNIPRTTTPRTFRY